MGLAGGTPRERLLVILEAIARHGPIQLGALVERTGLPRSSVHRMLQTLDDAGWLSVRVADHAYSLHSLVPQRLSGPGVSTVEIDMLRSEMRRAAREGLRADLALFLAPGHLEIVDVTDQLFAVSERLSLVADDLALAAQIGMPLDTLTRNLNQYMQNCPTEEREAIRSGQHIRALRTAREEGAVWGSGKLSVNLPIASETGRHGAIRFGMRRRRRHAEAFLDGFARDFARATAPAGFSVGLPISAGT